VRVYRGGLMDWGERRVWVLAPPEGAANAVPAGQITVGNAAVATARVRAGHWAVISQTIAAEHHLRIGESFTLPAPSPTTFKVAALATNMGWSSGAVILNPADYAHAWQSTEPSAYDVTVEPGVSPARVREEIRRALGPTSGLIAETARRHGERQQTTSREGLARLSQISALMLLSAILAMASAMGSMVWQRRARLAQLKLDGLSDGAVWRALLLESVLLLGVGCSTGALFGLYGQLVMTRALVALTGYPVILSFGLPAALGSCALVLAVAVAIVAIPGYVAARVQPAVAA
jgi:putative ABC transport system permease protein